MRRNCPVAITGTGMSTAGGSNLADCLASLETCGALVCPPPFETEFTSPVFLCPQIVFEESSESYSRTLVLALHVAREALRAASLREQDIAGMRTGIAVGTSVGASLNFVSYYRAAKKGETPPLREIDEYLTSNPAPAIAHIFGARGPLQTVTNACSSGADAIGIAASWIRLGLCDIALAGGVDALSAVTYKGFCSLRLTSPEPCRPFDRDRRGLTLGEGAAFVLLESETSRSKRGVSAKAFVVGYGTASDAWHLTAPHPECRGLRTAAEQAMAQAGASWKNIAFCNAHGTGTHANDAAEGAFYRTVCQNVPVIATKGGTGHTLGAAGAVEAVFTASHLAAGLLPPSPGFVDADPAIGFVPVNKPTEIGGRIALSLSLAFGGNNSVLALARGAA
jgi:3-oxoacyl-(acyl-carrier-protein) synthase